MRVYGATVDEETRCVHYSSERDVVAIRFYCCDRFYPCYRCHEEEADHRAERWPRSSGEVPAVLCGVCSETLTVATYLSVDRCPRCRSEFNPGCAAHAPRYFADAETDAARLIA